MTQSAQNPQGATSQSGDTLIWNFRLLAHNALDGFGGMGEGMSMQLAKDGRRILWLAHESAPKNFTAVDVSDPRAPKIIARAELPRQMRADFRVPTLVDAVQDTGELRCVRAPAKQALKAAAECRRRDLSGIGFADSGQV